MRPVAMFCTLVLLSGFSAAQVNGQATIMEGYASTWAPPPGAYALPLMPVIITPSIASVPSPLTVGASNATAGNIAGTSNSTSEMEPGASYSVETPLLSPGAEFFPTGSEQDSRPAESQNRALDLGAATFQSDYGVAQLAADSGPRSHAVKTYTNDDLVRLQQNTGEVKFGDKSEHLN